MTSRTRQIADAAGRITAVLTVSAAAAMAVAACSGADGTPAATSAPAPSTSPGQDAASSGGRAFCDTASRFNHDQVVIDQAVARAAHGKAAAGTGAQARTALESARDAEQLTPALPRQAPASLTSDVRTVVTAWTPFFSAVIRAGGDVTKIPLSAEQNLRSVVTTPRSQAAAKAVTSYEVRTCGFTPAHSH